MIRRIAQRLSLPLILVLALGGLPGLSLTTTALQQGDIFSPASGHAQVIAQGVAELPADAAWRAVFHSVAPGQEAELPPGGPGFLLIDTGGVLVEIEGTESLLAPAEATFHPVDAARLSAVGDRPAGAFSLDIVPPGDADDAGDGIPVYASAPFSAPAGARDIDLVRDRLEPEESTTVIGGEAPVLVLATLGEIRAEATDGSAATLRVGEAATFSGDIVLTAGGQAPATFVAAVIGRPVPGAGPATAGATPAVDVVGSVQLTVYACPPLVTPQDASPGRCLRDPEAAGLELATLAEGAPEVGASTERQGLPTWTGLPGGDYALRATGFKEGFGLFFVRGLEGIGGDGLAGFPAGSEVGYLIPISAEAADYALEVYVFVAGENGGQEPATTPSPVPEATEAVESTPTPAGPTEIPSVIQIETPVPGAPTPTPRPRATATPRPDPIARATSRPTERPLVTSTAVAQARLGTVTVRVLGCSQSIDAFNPANCAQAVDGFDVRLINEDGEAIGLGDATIGADGTVTWRNLPLGNYLFQQPVMLPGAVTYYAPGLQLASNGAGYIVSIGGEDPVAEFDVFSLPPAPAPTAPPAPVDSDGDGLPDNDETGIYGTDPANADSDLDGVFDGAEIAAGTDPLVAESSEIEPVSEGDSDGDRLLDADEAAYGTDPSVADSDGDGWFDGDEVSLGTDPLDGASFPVG